jgi:uncharacterized protein YkwD
MNKFSFSFLFTVIALVCQFSYGIQMPTDRLETSEIEQELYDLINRERTKRGILPLEPSQGLKILARKHSQYMAMQPALTHDSHDGKSFSQRLQEAGLYFKETGENVAFSESFLPEAIHHSFMRSNGHRENILGSRFDAIGIGVFFKEDKGYYITQDFIASLVAKPEEEFREMLEKQINARRIQKGLLPIPLLEELNTLAHEFSWKRAKGESLPDLPDHYGEILYMLITTPLLMIDDADMERIIHPSTTRAGIGIYFDREEKNPGGTYFISFLLLRKSASPDMSSDEIRYRLLDEINALKAEKRERPIKLDKNLSDEARIIAEKVNIQRGRTIFLSSDLKDYQVIPYNTTNPLSIPASVKVKLNYMRHRKIGIGIVPESDRKESPEKYWVVILFY